MDIQDASTLWIESDPVSGGSQSQVEFPTELGPFFEGSTTPRFGDEVQVAVQYAGLSFPAKRMDFHHNQVWRVNLPTTREGIGGYAGRILVSQKTQEPGLYRLSIVEMGGSTAELLREFSQNTGRLGTTTRLSGGIREYGYF